MSLWTPKFESVSYALDNWGSNPSATPGTSVSSGSTGNEGSWTASGLGTLAQEIAGFHLRVSDMSSLSGTANNTFLDIGVDPAGGTSYVDVVSNLVVGGVGVATVTGGGNRFFFPLRIPSGATVGFRARRVTAAGPFTLRVSMRCFGQSGWPEGLPAGTICQTIGLSETTAVDGTAFTPGNAADGTWTSLGTTSYPLWWWNLGYQIDNSTITAEYTYIELGVGAGAAGDTRTILKFMHGGTTGETCGNITGLEGAWGGYCPVPSGATMYVRGRCNNAPDSGYQAACYGVGG